MYNLSLVLYFCYNNNLILCLQPSGSIFHPRGNWLGLTPGEKIINMSAAGIRVSVLTDAGRIATFLDESIGNNTN